MGPISIKHWLDITEQPQLSVTQLSFAGLFAEDWLPLLVRGRQSRLRAVPALVGLGWLSLGQPFVFEHQLAHVTNMVDVEATSQVIELVLHYGG